MAKTPYVQEQILRIVENAAENSIFFLTDFVEYGAIESVRKILVRACSEGVLLHIAHGIYAKPKQSRFGMVPPSAEIVAQAIAERDNAEIMPSGAAAANIVGLSTQVPMSLVYLTTGTGRVINFGNRKITFKRAAPSNFAYKGKTIPLVVQALKNIGAENVSDYELTALRNYLSRADDKELLGKDLLSAPQWIQTIVKPIINQILSK